MCHQPWQIHTCQVPVTEQPPPQNPLLPPPPPKKPEPCGAPIAVYRDVYGKMVAGDPIPCPSDPELKLCEAGLFWVTVQKATTVEQIKRVGRCPNDMERNQPLHLNRPLKIEWIEVPDPQLRRCASHQEEHEEHERERAERDETMEEGIRQMQLQDESEGTKPNESELGQGESSAKVKTGDASGTVAGKSPPEQQDKARFFLGTILQKYNPLPPLDQGKAKPSLANKQKDSAAPLPEQGTSKPVTVNTREPNAAPNLYQGKAKSSLTKIMQKYGISGGASANPPPVDEGVHQPPTGQPADRPLTAYDLLVAEGVYPRRQSDTTWGLPPSGQADNRFVPRRHAFTAVLNDYDAPAEWDTATMAYVPTPPTLNERSTPFNMSMSPRPRQRSQRRHEPVPEEDPETLRLPDSVEDESTTPLWMSMSPRPLEQQEGRQTGEDLELPRLPGSEEYEVITPLWMSISPRPSQREEEQHAGEGRQDPEPLRLPDSLLRPPPRERRGGRFMLGAEIDSSFEEPPSPPVRVGSDLSPLPPGMHSRFAPPIPERSDKRSESSK